jgi:hypothetical protein
LQEIFVKQKFIPDENVGYSIFSNPKTIGTKKNTFIHKKKKKKNQMVG